MDLSKHILVESVIFPRDGKDGQCVEVKRKVEQGIATIAIGNQVDAHLVNFVSHKADHFLVVSNLGLVFTYGHFAQGIVYGAHLEADVDGIEPQLLWFEAYNGLFSQELFYHYFKRGTPDAHLLEYTFNQEGRDLTDNIMTFGIDNISPPKPIYDPVFALEDSIILFNFEADKIEYFDEKAKLIGETPIKFHRYLKWNGKWIMQDSWKKEVLVDRVRKEFYAVFEDENVTTLKKIDIKTGKVQNVASLSGFQFVQFSKPSNMYNGTLYTMYHTGLTVNDGTLYFLYHTGPTHSKALYRMKID